MKKVLLIGCIAAIGMISGSACAGFVDEDFKTQVTVFGKNAPTEQSVGLGNNVQLREALSQIIPHSFVQDRNNLNPDDLDRKVSWRGGKLWVDTLKEVLQSYPWITAKVDTTNKVVTLQGATGQKDGVTAAAPAAVWRIRRGERLSDAIDVWRKSAGWQGSYWEAPELESDMDQTFEGDFEGAIRQLVSALADQGIQIRALIYDGNKVIRIMEKK